jgi:holo-[acyl-carrier protein] synthase
MQILGIGTSIVECVRIGRLIERHGELFLARVYTAKEVSFCQGRKHVTEHFAERWAAKEAILKSLGTGRRQGLSWNDVEIRLLADGTARVFACGKAKERVKTLRVSEVLVTMSHCRAYATATAIALAGSEATP